MNGTWKEVVVVEFEVLCWNLPGRADETTKIPLKTAAVAV
jgi:hypothetical protein